MEAPTPDARGRPVDAAGEGGLPPAPPVGRRFSVLPVDDEYLVRRQVAQLVGADPRLELADEATEGREALEKIRVRRPDVILLDLIMPGMDGPEFLTVLKREKKLDIKVLILTAGPDHRAPLTPELYEAVRLGPDSMLYKGSVGDATICDEIVAVAGGQEHSPGRDLLRRMIERAKKRSELFSDEELEMLGLLAEGLKVKDFPPHVHSSSRVIENKLARLREKLGVENNPAAVARSYDLGLLPRQALSRHLADRLAWTGVDVRSCGPAPKLCGKPHGKPYCNRAEAVQGSAP